MTDLGFMGQCALGLLIGLVSVAVALGVAWIIGHADDDGAHERPYGDSWPYVPEVFPVHSATDSEGAQHGHGL